MSGPGTASEVAKDKVRAIAKSRNFKDAKEGVFAIRGGTDFNAAVKAHKLDETHETVMIISTKDKAPPHIPAYRHLIAHIVGDGISYVNEVVSR